MMQLCCSNAQEGQQFKMAGVAVIKALPFFICMQSILRVRASAIKLHPPSYLFKPPHGCLPVRGSIFVSQDFLVDASFSQRVMCFIRHK